MKPTSFCVVLVAVGLGSGLGLAQSSGKLMRRELVVPESGLQITMTGLAPSSEWVVAVKVQGPQDLPGVALVSRTLLPTPKGGPVVLSTDISDVPNSAVSITPGLIRIDGSGVKANGLVVYAVIPKATRVAVTTNGTMISNAVVATSIMFRSGVVVSEEVKGLQSAMARLVRPVTPSMLGLAKTGRGDIVASPVEALRHLTASPMPGIPLKAVSSSSSRHITVQLTISADGRVTQVEPLGGDVSLADALRPSLTQWRFNGFVMDGIPVQVKTLFAFTVGQDGSVQRFDLK